MRVFYLVICLFIVLPGSFNISFAGVLKANLVLFSGDVYLIAPTGQMEPAEIGEQFTFKKYPKIKLAEGSIAFIQYGTQMIKVSQNGILELQPLFRSNRSNFSRTLTFLKEIGTPLNYVSQTTVRGNKLTPAAQKQTFSTIWEKLVQEPARQKTNISPNNLLAAAAWFDQQKQPAKTAYTLEKLSGQFHNKNPFYKTLRDESLTRTSINDINAEITQTQQLISQKIPILKYKAVLIGVDRYEDSYWNQLDNPVKDVEAIKNLLKTRYTFSDSDILVQKNPTFSEIVKAFNQLKKEVNEKTALLIYYAGHGYYPEDEDQGYWIPADGGKPETLKSFIPTSIVLSKIKALPTAHTLLIADSCFSGSLIQKSRGEENTSGFYTTMAGKKSRQIITSGGLEPVNDAGGKGHSIFASTMLKVLSEERSEPLSATELAFYLRKEVKNAGGEQTPEYGRLSIPQDKNGEFFFVSKTYHSDKNSITTPSNKIDVQSEDDEDEDKDSWINFGLFSMKFKDNENDPTGKKYNPVQKRGLHDWLQLGFSYNTIALKFDNMEKSGDRVQRNISGWGLQTLFRRSVSRFGYGVKATLGKITKENFENGEGDDDNNDRNLHGYYLNTGLFADYSVYTFKQFSLQLGGELRYSHASIDDYLGKDNVIVQSVSVCLNTSYPYMFKNWFIHPFLDICPRPIWTGGNISGISNGTAKNVKQYYSYSTGASAGFKF